MRIFISILFLLFSLYSYSQTVELYPGWRVDVTSIVTTSDSTYNVSFSINHPYNTYNGNDVQLNDVLYTNSVSYGDDCNEYIVTNIIDQFAGELVVTVTDRLSQGIPAQGIGVLVRLSESGLTHWIANVGDPLNQCISAKMAGSIETKFVDITNQIDSIYAGTFSMYISDSINTAQLITEDTMFIIGDAVQLDGNRFRIITPSAVIDSNSFLFYVDSAGVKFDTIYGGDTVRLPAATGELNTDTDSIYFQYPDTLILATKGDTVEISNFIDTDTFYVNTGDTVIQITRNDTIPFSEECCANTDSFYVYFADTTVFIQQGDTIFLSTPIPPPPPSFPDSTVFCGDTTLVVDVTNPVTGRTWMDRNLGASKVATSHTNAFGYGDLYQWGRFPDGHQCRISQTTTTKATTVIPFTGGDWDGKFVIGSQTWLTSQTSDLWQGLNGINNPCPTGYRIPTRSEWDEERSSWSSNNRTGALASPLKLPAAGERDYDSGVIDNVGSYGGYWASSISGLYVYYLKFTSWGASSFNSPKADGYSVRCIKEPTGLTPGDTVTTSFKAGYLYDLDDTTAIRPVVIDNDIYFQLNEEAVEDVVAEMFNNQIHENITITYDDSEASNLILRAVDTSGRNQALTITNDTLFLTDADTTLKVLLPQVVDTDTDSIYVNNDGVITLVTRGDTIVLPIFVDTNNDSIYFDNNGVITLAERNDTIVLPVDTNTDTDTLYFNLGGVLYQQTRNDTLNIPVAIDTSFANQDTVFFVSGGDTTFVVLPPPDGDDWGNQFVITDSTLSGKGTVSEPLTVNYLPDLVFDGDSSVTNELQDIDSVVLSGNLLTVYISNGASASVDLSGITLTDRADTSGYNLTFQLNGNDLELTDGDGQLSVNLSAYLDNTDTDSIIIDSLGTLLVKQRGDIITLIPDTDTNTDEQNLSLSGDSLLIERGTGVDLSVYRDTFIDTNTDGDTIYFDNRDSVRLIVRGDTIFLPEDLVFDGDSSITNELQDLSRVGDSIQITNGTGVYISDFFDNTDTSGYNQSLTFANGQLTITDGNNSLIVTIPDSVGGFPLPTDSITFNNNEAGPSQAELNWDETLGYLVYGGLNNQLIQIGQDVLWLGQNTTGVRIDKGTVVQVSNTPGTSGKFNIAPFTANSSANPNFMIGIVADDIDDGEIGYVMSQGKIRQINLSTYNVGDVLYASPTTPGALTAIEPTGNNLKLPIAFVVENVNNGTLAVRVKTGEALRDLHDVDVSGVTDNQIIKYDAALGYWTLSNDEDTQLTEEQVEDYVGGMLTGTQTGITVTYQDGTNDIDFVAADPSPTNEIQGLTLTNDGDDRFTIGLSDTSSTINLLEGNNVNLSYKDTLGGNSIVVDVKQAFPYGREGISVEDSNKVKLGFDTLPLALNSNNVIGFANTNPRRFIGVHEPVYNLSVPEPYQGSFLGFVQSPGGSYLTGGQYDETAYIKYMAFDNNSVTGEHSSNIGFEYFFLGDPLWNSDDYTEIPFVGESFIRQKINVGGNYPNYTIDDYIFEIDSDDDIRLNPTGDLQFYNIPQDDTDANLLTIDNNVVSYRAVSSLPDDNNYVNSISMSDGNNDDTWDITLGREGLANVTTTVDLSEYSQDLSLNTNTLSLSGSSATVNLSPYLDNTDDQELSIANNILSIEDGTTTIDLTPYVNEDTDLSFSGASSPYTLNSSTGTDVTFAAGNGITLSESSDQLTITNANPDQVVNLTAGTNVSITGDYPNFTISSQQRQDVWTTLYFDEYTNYLQTSYGASPEDFFTFLDVNNTTSRGPLTVSSNRIHFTDGEFSILRTVNNAGYVTPSIPLEVGIQYDIDTTLIPTKEWVNDNDDVGEDTRVNVFEGATSKTANTTKLTFDANDFDVAASGTEATVSVNFPADNNTTYDLSAAANVLNPSIILTPSSGTADEVNLIGGNNVTIQSDGSNNITISSTDENTTYSSSQGIDDSESATDFKLGETEGKLWVSRANSINSLRRIFVETDGDGIELYTEGASTDNQDFTALRIVNNNGSLTGPVGASLSTKTIKNSGAIELLMGSELDDRNTNEIHSLGGALEIEVKEPFATMFFATNGGSINFSDALDNANVILKIDATNNRVGINTELPSEDFHINGDMRLTGEFRDGNNEAGTSGQILSSTGSITDWKSLADLGIQPAGSYLTTETDPIFGASASAGITSTNISNWNTAYGWGNHALENYLTSEVDGSVSNEGSLSVGAGTSTTSLIQSNTSGSSAITLQAGTNITLSESSNTITINATGDGTGTDDQNISGSFFTPSTGDLVIGIEDGTNETVNLDGRYLTSITLSGDATGSGTNSITVTVVDDSHNHVISNVDGLQTALNGKQPLDADLTTIGGLAKADGNFIVGNGTTWVVESGSTARTSLGLGSLATLSAVGSSQITDNSVSAIDLNVSGNGTTAQFLRSDGDGSFTWATPTDNNTTYSAGNGISLSGTTFSVGAGGGLTQEVSGLAHANTSNQASINNSNGTVIQDVTLDDYGHVTALASANLDSRYYTESEVDGFLTTGAVANGATTLATGDQIYDFVTGLNYTSNTGDITGVTAGIGLDGGASSGNATLNLGYSSLATAQSNEIITNRYLDFHEGDRIYFSRYLTTGASNDPLLVLQSNTTETTLFTYSTLQFSNQGGNNANPITANISLRTHNDDSQSALTTLAFRANNYEFTNESDNKIGGVSALEVTGSGSSVTWNMNNEHRQHYEWDASSTNGAVTMTISNPINTSGYVGYYTMRIYGHTSEITVTVSGVTLKKRDGTNLGSITIPANEDYYIAFSVRGAANTVGYTMEQ